ncbi:MAG: hypothetical protein M5U34_07480 [Chloroflexi bacterium]|nr:hypothetical protein [Chloroflexota bacterium]
MAEAPMTPTLSNPPAARTPQLHTGSMKPTMTASSSQKGGTLFWNGKRVVLGLRRWHGGWGNGRSFFFFHHDLPYF